MKKQVNIYEQIAYKSQQGMKQLAVLIDPDHASEERLIALLDQVTIAGVDYLFVGGSLMTTDTLQDTIATIKSNTDLPVVLFPGSVLQIAKEADAILFLSLISGRNPELLIGNHVVAAPYLKASRLEVIATAYLLIDCGQATTASYISNTQPIPFNKPEIAATTALAGEYLGMKLTYLDGGSGAMQPVSSKMISEVKRTVQSPLIVGGGVNDVDKAADAYSAGADVIVMGNALEKTPSLITSVCEMKRRLSAKEVSS
jgi:phosphoglycerol geranylgeranyltransferase